MNVVDLLPLAALPIIAYIWVSSSPAFGQRVAGTLGFGVALIGPVFVEGPLLVLVGVALIAISMHLTHGTSENKSDVGALKSWGLNEEKKGNDEGEIVSPPPEQPRPDDVGSPVPLTSEIAVEDPGALVSGFDGGGIGIQEDHLPKVNPKDLTTPLSKTARDIFEIIKEMHKAVDGSWAPNLDYLITFLRENHYFNGMCESEVRDHVLYQVAVLVENGHLEALPADDLASGHRVLELIPVRPFGGS